MLPYFDTQERSVSFYVLLLVSLPRGYIYFLWQCFHFLTNKDWLNGLKGNTKIKRRESESKFELR